MTRKMAAGGGSGKKRSGSKKKGETKKTEAAEIDLKNLPLLEKGKKGGTKRDVQRALGIAQSSLQRLEARNHDTAFKPLFEKAKARVEELQAAMKANLKLAQSNNRDYAPLATAFIEAPAEVAKAILTKLNQAVDRVAEEVGWTGEDLQERLNEVEKEPNPLRKIWLMNQLRRDLEAFRPRTYVGKSRDFRNNPRVARKK